MNKWAGIGLGTLVVAATAAAFGYVGYRGAMRYATRAYARIAVQSAVNVAQRVDPEMVAALPEIAQRYFRHAIAPGTPLYSGVELEMEGKFLLGDKNKAQIYAMTAREALRAPDQFAWLPRMRSGAMTITGSDALIGGEAWTRFQLLKLVPVVDERTSPDLVRSAQFRAAVETALWIPPSLLPANGVEWAQVGEDRARVTLRRVSPAIELFITLDKTGRVVDVVGQRWSNANSDKRFRLQPFGGTMLAERTFQGLTVPSQVSVGNHYGTDDYHPFFQATLTSARYR